jgi:O-succinylbenzoic acid--CoA ligase
MTRYPSLAASARLAAADARPEPAIVEGAIAWTWRELDGRADAIARELLLVGVRPGSRVALLTAPSAAAIATLHAIARVGGVVAPLGPGLTVAELAVAGEVIAPDLVIHDPALDAAARAIGVPLRSLDELTGTSPGPETPDELAPPQLPAPDHAAPAAIVLTSGTTGRSKAVVLSTAALVASAEAWLAALPEATGWLLAVGLAHVAGLGVVWRAALSGVPLVVLARPDPAAILAALGAAPHPSHVSLVPTVLTRLLDLGGDVRPPLTLRAVPLGGGAISAGLVRRAIEAGWPVVPTYGLSEAGSGVTASPTDEAAIHPDTAGRPLPGVGIRIVEPDPEGIGEIEVTGPALFSGYIGDPLTTTTAWSEDGWLRTGDLGRLDADGRLIVADRRTDRIVRGGENISPTEVEAVLLEHPAVADAAVVARADPAYGQVPVAAIVLRHGHADPGNEALVALCREGLARFKVPVAFIRLDAIPHTAGGKPRRAELRAVLDPTPRIEQESPA